jgi:hypothetical protein
MSSECVAKRPYTHNFGSLLSNLYSLLSAFLKCQLVACW